MKCPACFNNLTQTQIGTLVVDVCQGGCGGIWFDAFELKQVDEETDPLGETLLHIQRDENLKVDGTRKRACPRCDGIKLQRHRYNPSSHVEVDECPNCGGYWLDDGELARIRTEKNQMAQAKELRQSGVSTELLRYIYQLKTRHREGDGASFS